MPMTLRVDRTSLQRLGAGAVASGDLLPDGGFPLIVRPVGSHAGRGLQKLDAAAALPAYLAERGEAEFYISRFIDYSGADGLFRKYRIAFIDGVPYACHMAIAEQWMIYYLNANMGASAAKRAEEAAFMAEFDTGFARRHGRGARRHRRAPRPRLFRHRLRRDPRTGGCWCSRPTSR